MDKRQPPYNPYYNPTNPAGMPNPAAAATIYPQLNPAYMTSTHFATAIPAHFPPVPVPPSYPSPSNNHLPSGYPTTGCTGVGVPAGAANTPRPVVVGTSFLGPSGHHLPPGYTPVNPGPAYSTSTSVGGGNALPPGYIPDKGSGVGSHGPSVYLNSPYVNNNPYPQPAISPYPAGVLPQTGPFPNSNVVACGVTVEPTPQEVREKKMVLQYCCGMDRYSRPVTGHTIPGQCG